MKRSSLRIALSILWSALPAVAAFAAEPERWSRIADTVFQHYTAEHGFPSGSVTALAQDGDGFLWVGTQGGLLRWDGYRVRRYVANAKSADALHDNFIQRLHTDARGRLWIGTSTAGLARYDRDHDRFISYPTGDKGVGGVSVLGIADDGPDALLIATSAGLDRLDIATSSFTHFRHDAKDPGSLPDNYLRAVLRDRNDVLWIGSRSGLIRRDAGAAKFQRVPLLAATETQPEPESLLEDSAGRIWIGTGAHGAFVLEPSTGATRRVAEQSTGANLQTEDVYALAEARPGEIWLGTFGQGIVAVDASTLAARRIRRDPLLPGTLADNTIWSLHRDRSGLVWTGTGRGLSRMHPDQRALSTVLGAIDRKAGLSDPDVISILPALDGRIWLGLGNNGVDVIDPNGASNARVAEMRPDSAQPASALPREKVLALAQGSDLYVGSVRGLYRRDTTGRLARIDIPDRPADDSADALKIIDGRLTVGTWNGAVWRLDVDPESGTASVRAKSTEKLTDHRVLTLEPAPNGDLWVGTGNGLTRLDATLNVVERIQPDAANPAALVGGYVTSLAFDAKGRLWVGTLGGISVLEGRDANGRAQFRTVPPPPGADTGSVAMLLKDAAGRMWASGDNGLAVFDPDTYAGRILHRADGLAIGTYWTGSGALTPQGELLFGGLGGMTIVHPERFKAWDFRPPVVVTEVRVGGKPALAARFNGEADNNGGDGARAARPGTEPLVLTPEANSVAVEFAALDYTAPERNRYAYRLDGYDADWIATDPSRRLAAYTNLPPGDFTLRIRGSNRDGVFTERELALPIRVLPAWYQTLWFDLLLVFAGGVLVYAIVRSRTALLRARQRELELKVQERTAQLEAASRALEEASLTDTLTGLRNRRFLTRYLDDDALLAMRRYAAHAGDAPLPDADLVFYLIDLDHFKAVNDTYGHAAGDAVLVELARRLKVVFRETDYVVRWGGEEFLVVARATTRTTAAEVAERLRATIAGDDFVLPDGQRLHKTGSIGFVAFPFQPGHPSALQWIDIVDLADIAMYAAKRGGRDGWVGLMAGEVANQGGLLQRLKDDPQQALHEGELRVITSLDAQAVFVALSSQG